MTRCVKRFWNYLFSQVKAAIANAYLNKKGAIAQETGQESMDNNTRKHTPSRGAFHLPFACSTF